MMKNRGRLLPVSLVLASLALAAGDPAGAFERSAAKAPGRDARPMLAQVGQVVVPSVLRQRWADAHGILRARGLGARHQGNVDTTNRSLAGRVARQTPSANARVNRGAVVNLALYRFVGQVRVPNVIGRPVVVAQNMIRGEGLRFRTAGFVNTSTGSLQGTVARQSPAPNTRVSQGTVVQLTFYRFARAPAG